MPKANTIARFRLDLRRPRLFIGKRVLWLDHRGRACTGTILLCDRSGLYALCSDVDSVSDVYVTPLAKKVMLIEVLLLQHVKRSHTLRIGFINDRADYRSKKIRSMSYVSTLDVTRAVT